MPAQDLSAEVSSDPKPRGTYLVRRVYGPRIVGVLLSAACVVAALLTQPFHPLYVLGAVFNILVWPHLAYRLASRSTRPLVAEKFNLWMDSLYVGFWMAAFGFSLVPSAALVMATSLSNVTVGGVRFLAVGWLGHLAGAALGVLVWGLRWHPASPLSSQLGALPLLVLYPLLMGGLMYRLANQLKQSRRELRFLSEHDALSGVHNRRFFDHYLRQVFSQFLRHERALSLLVCDVDHFKRINDRLGHAAGDEVIRQFGAALTQCARAGDVVARLGGDEFVVLLTDANAEQAFHYARRVQEKLCVLLEKLPQLPETSVSFGVAMARAGMKSHERWLEQADTALYRTKATDRGGVSLAAADESMVASAG